MSNLPPRTVTAFAASDRYRAEVHDYIVGGAHTYSKGDDQFPALAPAAIARGKAGRVWDLDGNEYVDCALGLGAVSLGHAYEPVLRAVRAQLDLGAAFQRPASVELDLAKEFLALCPGMDRIKFAKNGSNATTAAVKLARAFTGRELVAFPVSHPFYSFDDWFIGSTTVHAGVPGSIRDLSVRYDPTRPESLAALFRAHPGEIACVISEPEEWVPIAAEVIREMERLARANGALFIVDEMVSGFRAGLPGAYVALGLTPDMVTWGKAAGNGFSFCALTGRAEVMDLGGIKQTERPRVFLLSTTHGGEAHVLAAARAVLQTYREEDVLGRHRRAVATVAAGMSAAVERHRLQAAIDLHAVSWRILVVCKDGNGQASAALRTLLLQEMIGRGILFQGVFLPCYSHTEADLQAIVAAFDQSCAVYAHALRHGLDGLLTGEAVRPVFRKYVGCRESCPQDPCPHEGACRQSPR